MFPDEIETDRLRLERLTIDDLFDFYEYSKVDAPDIDEITRHVTWSPHQSLNETREFIEIVEKNWDDRNEAAYVIRPRDEEENADELGGVTGLDIDWDRRTGTLGLWLRKPLWGRGYSGERAAALMALAFERLDLDLVSVSHHPDNEQSERAVQKYIEAHGGRREGLLRNYLVYQDGTVVDEVRYSVSQEEYYANRE
jgi:ribosomal-protein-alanine N-acetyltransferase